MIYKKVCFSHSYLQANITSRQLTETDEYGITL